VARLRIGRDADAPAAAPRRRTGRARCRGACGRSARALAAVSLDTLRRPPLASPPCGSAADAPRQRRIPEPSGRAQSCRDESSSLTGGVGLLHMQHAQGTRRASSTSRHHRVLLGELPLHPQLPVRESERQQPQPADERHDEPLRWLLAVSATVARWLELYGGTSAVANSDTANKPSLLQCSATRTSGSRRSARSVSSSRRRRRRALAHQRTGAVGLDGSARAEVRGSPRPTCVRPRRRHRSVSASTHYSVDNTAQTITSVEQQRNAPITRIERYGLGINRVDHFDIGLGAEAFFVEERIRPFIEYNIMIPVNARATPALR